MQKFKVYFWKHLPKEYFKEIKEKYKDRKNDYMNVYICDNREEMYDFEDKIENTKLQRDYGARTYCYNKNYHDVKTQELIKTGPCCGNITFDKEYFYMNAITHESTHAVIGYFSRKLKDCQNIFIKLNEFDEIIEEEYDLEELFCYMVGNIANQIACQYKEDK